MSTYVKVSEKRSGGKRIGAGRPRGSGGKPQRRTRKLLELVDRLVVHMGERSALGKPTAAVEKAMLKAYALELARQGESWSYEDDCRRGAYESTLGEDSVHREARIVPIPAPPDSVRTVRFGDLDENGSEIAYLAEIASDCKVTGMGFYECPEDVQRERLLENLSESVRPLFADMDVWELVKLHDTGKLFAMSAAEMRSREFAENRPHGGLVAFPAVVRYGTLPDGTRGDRVLEQEVRAELAYIDGNEQSIYYDSYCIIMP